VQRSRSRAGARAIAGHGETRPSGHRSPTTTRCRARSVAGGCRRFVLRERDRVDDVMIVTVGMTRGRCRRLTGRMSPSIHGVDVRVDTE
jgi:hypothetical protein